MYYKKVSIEEKFPPLMKFVTTIDENGEHRVYRLTKHGWNMRDGDGINSPNNNLQITHWLEEVDLIELEKIEKELTWIIDDLGKINSPFREGSVTVQQITLKNGKEAQIRIEVTTDEDVFTEVCD